LQIGHFQLASQNLLESRTDSEQQEARGRRGKGRQKIERSGIININKNQQKSTTTRKHNKQTNKQTNKPNNNNNNNNNNDDDDDGGAYVLPSQNEVRNQWRSKHSKCLHSPPRHGYLTLRYERRQQIKNRKQQKSKSNATTEIDGKRQYTKPRRG